MLAFGASGFSKLSPTLTPADFGPFPGRNLLAVAAADALGEYGPAACGDRHALVVDREHFARRAAARDLCAVEDVDLLALDRAPGAGRRIGGADQVVDVGDGLGPIDLGNVLLEPALVGAVGEVLRVLERLAGAHEFEALDHGVDAHREQLLEVDVAQRLVGADLDRLLHQDRTLIEPFVGPEDRQARARLAHGDRPVDGRRPAVRRQQRGVVLERAEPGRIQHRLRHEQQHVGHHAHVGIERLHQLERFRRLPALGLVHGQALLRAQTA